MTAVRPLRGTDAADWRRLWRDYLAFYETVLPEAVFDATFARLLDPAEPMRGLVAERDGRVIGIANLIVHRHGWRLGDVCYLQDLFVEPTERSSGAGRALIEATYALADAEGWEAVYWTTQDFNETARALYDRVGVLTPFIKYVRP
jgi:GNAT superfamily N-acetyltransferase